MLHSFVSLRCDKLAPRHAGASICWIVGVLACRLIGWISCWPSGLRSGRSACVSDSDLDCSPNGLTGSPVSLSPQLEWGIVPWLLPCWLAGLLPATGCAVWLDRRSTRVGGIGQSPLSHRHQSADHVNGWAGWLTWWQNVSARGVWRAESWGHLFSDSRLKCVAAAKCGLQGHVATRFLGHFFSDTFFVVKFVGHPLGHFFFRTPAQCVTVVNQFGHPRLQPPLDRARRPSGLAICVKRNNYLPSVASGRGWECVGGEERGGGGCRLSRSGLVSAVQMMGSGVWVAR